MSGVSEILESFHALLSASSTIWVELAAALCFTLGFLLLRIKSSKHPAKGAKKINATTRVHKVQSNNFSKQRTRMEDAANSGNATKLVQEWRAVQASSPTPKDLLKPVVQAFLDTETKALVPEIMAHLQCHKSIMANQWAATTILDAVARSGNMKVLEDFWGRITKELGIPHGWLLYEAAIAGYAAAGYPEKVEEFNLAMQKDNFRLSARGYSLIIKGFLKNGFVDEVLQYMVEMTQRSHAIPSFSVAQLLRVASETKRVQEVHKKLKERAIPMLPEAIAVLLEDCSRVPDGKFAHAIEQDARAANTELTASSYESLLKVYAASGDGHALQILKEIQNANLPISDSLCVSLLTRCAESKFIRLAEEIVCHVRKTSKMSIPIYSSLMKVYAYSKMYHKACDLYDDILADGIEPDGMMYGCLMKFSVECGRTQLSQKLSEKVSVPDIQNYMSLIRAAGRDRDVDRAFAVLQQLRESNVAPDSIALNCVVDVCVKAGNIQRAEKLVAEMEDLKLEDIITYNTLLKGYCQKHDSKAAKNLFSKMEESGKEPNEVSYNCLLNCLSSNGNYQDCWEIVDHMRKRNVQPDHYTVSILLKGTKNMRGAHDVQKCFDFLDQSGVDPCCDDILLNTVLEIYIRHKEFGRLSRLVAKFEKSNLQPSMATYGSIIKAFANLNEVDKCWFYWDQIQEEHGLEPNDIVWGCMLDALVTNRQVDDAMQLFQRQRRKPNAVICSILVKGLANTQQPRRALQLWREMKQNGMKMNVVAYNVMIDSQARLGNMDEVMEIVQEMAADNCQPDSITHSTICKGYAVKGELAKAIEVLENMQQSKVPHDAIVYNTILDGCAKHKRVELVEPILETMEANAIAPTNFTLGILLKIYGRQRDLDKAFEAFEALPRKGRFQPNAQVWSSLMNACITTQSTDKALKVFKDMQGAGVMPETRACTSLVQSLVRLEKLHEAIDVVDLVYGLRTKPSHKQRTSIDEECLESLLTILAQKGFLEELGAPLLQRLRAAKVSVSGRLMASALRTEVPTAPKSSSTKKYDDKKDTGHPWGAKDKTIGFGK
eukprot:CAMPEP_0197709602 /NCGR_PEP_ID=MMETSP1338-20131121/128535_1 /TAXON_ID=43686 ORGANISM="Pelagodinium beii, Strain RCC1491" /NCGR_SAMPLE_ID=MMETSP1338 /ASSEMBLY_ACC=CAM_ASM_000754 /LENGTH=1057 /DNA_ID=CAMNT_0043293537 /DNA_START=54 /DNA_END=3227 /DNA_ORIENTATION=-